MKIKQLKAIKEDVQVQNNIRDTDREKVRFNYNQARHYSQTNISVHYSSIYDLVGDEKNLRDFFKQNRGHITEAHHEIVQQESELCSQRIAQIEAAYTELCKAILYEHASNIVNKTKELLKNESNS